MEKRYYIAIMVMILLSVGLVSANSDGDFSQAQSLIQQGISCDSLREDQLELIGDYYMEQMHPGEAHEYMDQMMGGEGSENLRLVHIAMAKRIYCNERVYAGYGMMGGMIYPGMMGYNYQQPGGFNWFLVLSLITIIILLAILIFRQTRRR